MEMGAFDRVMSGLSGAFDRVMSWKWVLSIKINRNITRKNIDFIFPLVHSVLMNEKRKKQNRYANKDKIYLLKLKKYQLTDLALACGMEYTLFCKSLYNKKIPKLLIEFLKKLERK